MKTILSSVKVPKGTILIAFNTLPVTIILQMVKPYTKIYKSIKMNAFVSLVALKAMLLTTFNTSNNVKEFTWMTFLSYFIYFQCVLRSAVCCWLVSLSPCGPQVVATSSIAALTSRVATSDYIGPMLRTLKSTCDHICMRPRLGTLKSACDYTIRGVWIIPSFWIGNYMLHVLHFMMNYGQHQWVIPPPFSIGKHYQWNTIPIFGLL